MTFAQANRLAAQHDVVMVGYRGVDGSSVLNCPEVTAALETRTTSQSVAERVLPGLRLVREAARAIRRRPRRLHVGGAGRRHRGRARRARYQRIDLLSESAGTVWE